MNVHATMMARGRALQIRVQARPVTYIPPDSANSQRVPDVMTIYLSAEDDIFDVDRGEERVRAITVNVEIGSGAGMLAAAHIGGKFLIDVDGTGTPEPWTIKKFENADAGFKRCLCTRPILQKGNIGAPRRDR